MTRVMLGLAAAAWLGLAGCGTTVGTSPLSPDVGPDGGVDAMTDAAGDSAGDIFKDTAPPPVDVVTPAADVAPTDAIQADSVASDVAVPVDVAADVADAIVPFVCCKDDASCGADMLCIDGKACVSAKLSAGQCWHPSDCALGQECQGAFVCPCNADCFPADKPGTCAVVPGGCCNDTKGCSAGNTCAGGGANKICKSQAELKPGGCWADADCSGGTCKDANVCPCGAMCLVADKQGSCGGAACTTLDPNSFGMCDMIVGVVFDGKACVYASGCGCANACASVFKDLTSCQTACGLQ